jgi:hypothetical protein
MRKEPDVNNEDKTGYEGWAIVELFGRQMIAGRLTTEVIGGGSFVRVDVPATDGAPGFTKFFGPGAIYAITPTDEATAAVAAGRLRIRPVEAWVVPQLANRALVAPTVIDEDNGPDSDTRDDGGEDDDDEEDCDAEYPGW